MTGPYGVNKNANSNNNALVDDAFSLENQLFDRRFADDNIDKHQQT